MEKKQVPVVKSTSSLSISPITKTCDLLQCTPIKVQIQRHGVHNVLSYIKAALTKCSLGLGLEVKIEQLDVVAEDLLEKYGWESIEDIIFCLKKGRQGIYSFGYNKRALSVPVITEWMAKHLTDKSKERERLHRIRVEGNKVKMTDEKAQNMYDKFDPKILESGTKDVDECFEEFKKQYQISIIKNLAKDNHGKPTESPIPNAFWKI